MNPYTVDGDSKQEFRIMPSIREEIQIDAGNKIAKELFPYIKGKSAAIERTGAFGNCGKTGILANNV